MATQWTIFKASLDHIVGREQAGSRPVLVVSAEPINELYDVILVAPLTSRKPGRQPRLGEVLLPEGTAGLPLESLVICYQVRALDKSRLGDAYGAIPDGPLRGEVQAALADCLDLVLAKDV